MKKRVVAVVLLAVLALWSGTAAETAAETAEAGVPSPWDRGQTELTGAAALPVRYPAVFERERETRGYDPRFLPGMITFSPDNRPVIRVGLENAAAVGRNRHRVTSRQAGAVNLIQFLGRDGRWRVTDGHVRAVRKALGLSPEAELTVLFGERTADAVEFDGRGGAYTLVTAGWRDGKRRGMRTLLAFSPDGFRTFRAAALPAACAGARLEPYRCRADRGEPPWILMQQRDSGRYALVKVGRPESGAPVLGEPIPVTPENWKPIAGVGTMAGDGAPMITAGGRTFVVFMDLREVNGQPGTPQYIVSYDHRTGEVSAPLLLGTTGHRLDGHNVPVIDLDSRGRLHVVGGAHWHSFKHWVSREPGSISGGWEAPEAIGAELDNRWSRNGLSYPGMLIDADDTMHIVARGRSLPLKQRDAGDHHDTRYRPEELDYALVCLRRPAAGPWEERRDLATPAWPHYSNWYHKVTLDRRGRLYCVYYYYASWLKQSPAAADYRRRWPEDIAPDGTLPDRNLRAHDPVLIRSTDGGLSWSIVRTGDFAK